MTMTTKKPLRTALEVYHAGYQNQHMWGGYVLASRNFFVELREAICYELEHYGFCPLVDELLEKPPAYIDKVAYAVFCDLTVGYPSGQLVDTERERTALMCLTTRILVSAGLRAALWNSSMGF